MGMKTEQFRQELGDMLKKDFPELLLEVYADRGCPTVAIGMGCVNISFPIDKVEWVRNDTKEKKQRLVRLRLLEVLRKLERIVDHTILKCGGDI
jgi:hypothetical protein